MQIKTVKLRNFRNYSNEEFALGQLSLVVGQNGAGKSNLMEAIYLLATGRSFRADVEAEMIKYKESVAGVEYGVLMDSIEWGAKLTLTDGSAGYARKKFEVNGIPRRQVDTVGKFKAVMFGPVDMELLTGSPSRRRNYLDFVLVQADREYRRCLVAYEKGLRQRNKLLDLIREGKASRNQLFFWDKTLIKNGEYLTLSREKYLNSLEGEDYRAIYDRSVISELRLKQYEVEELAAGSTLVGPHRDEMVVEYRKDGESKDVAKYGSRGEQRMAMLWLKLGEKAYLSNQGDLPVVLLDDIFSELDSGHRQKVMELVAMHILAGGQVIMTSSEVNIQAAFKFDTVIEL